MENKTLYCLCHRLLLEKSMALLKSMELQPFIKTGFLSLCSCMVEGFPCVEGKHISPS